MLTLLVALSAVSAAPNQAASVETCRVGRAALEDLPAFNVNRNYASYYASPDTNRTDLLDVCPKLRRAVPAGYPFADDEARARVHGPIPGQNTPPYTMIFAIDPPRVSADGKSAIVTMRYECSGLCGGYTDFRYTRDRKGWRQEKAEVQVVS